MNEALKEYLFGERSTGLLLIGNRGMDLLKDAMYVASSLLGVEAGHIESHPDYLFVGLEEGSRSIGVEKATEIIERSSFKPVSATRIVVVLDNMDKLTVPAQNKLLKLLEESETTLLVGVCYEDSLLPTIKSRMQCIYYRETAVGQYEGDPVEYFSDDASKPYFEAVRDVMFVKEYPELLKVLHLVKEKDGAEFFSSCRESVGKMISYIGFLANEELKEKYDPKTAYVTGLCGTHWNRCNAVSYTKSDFFALIAEIVAVLEGRRN